jgi:hypothetical protein
LFNSSNFKIPGLIKKLIFVKKCRLLKSISILFLFILSASVFGQIEITTNPFRFESDTRLRYRVDYIDKEIIENRGTNQNWNLKNIESPLYKELVINLINSGTVQNLKLIDGDYTRSIKRSKSNFDETGLSVRLNSFQTYNFQYNKPISFSYKNLKYGAKYSEKSSFDLSLSRDELPFRISKALPDKVKNIKIIGEIFRSYHCDASGRFILEDKNVSVLRMKVVEKVELRLYDMYSGTEIPFNDNSALSLIYPGVGTNVHFLFFSNSTKMHFAKVRPNKNNDDYVIEFQSDIDGDSDFNISGSGKDFILYPNPTYGITKFLFSNFSEGFYTIDIYNVIGKKIWSKQQNIDQESVFKFDFSFLRKGTYLISVKDKSGNPVATKKLVIIGV